MSLCNGMWKRKTLVIRCDFRQFGSWGSDISRFQALPSTTVGPLQIRCPLATCLDATKRLRNSTSDSFRLLSSVFFLSFSPRFPLLGRSRIAPRCRRAPAASSAARATTRGRPEAQTRRNVTERLMSHVTCTTCHMWRHMKKIWMVWSCLIQLGWDGFNVHRMSDVQRCAMSIHFPQSRHQ